MSLESAIENLTAAIQRNTDALDRLLAQSTEPAFDAPVLAEESEAVADEQEAPATPKPPTAKKTPPPPAPKEPEPEPADTLTPQEANTKIIAICREHFGGKRTAVDEVLTEKFDGARNIAEFTGEQLAKLVAELEAKIPNA